MILKIIIDTSIDPDSFEDLGMRNQTIYEQVSGVNALEDEKEYTLKFCHIICDVFSESPERARLTVRTHDCRLYVQYKKPAEDGLDSIDISVSAKTVQDFPKI